ncbi:MAG: ABC transporter substrate-binding protein [Labilithrix sp.]|nr:ABC transporter substrate-binding protein [Labilithrix sp.]MCW5815149.1 ABC transporter substrate-binding protein [Labilithrix sp.]
MRRAARPPFMLAPRERRTLGRTQRFMLALAVVLVHGLAGGRTADAREAVRVLVPDRDNLQYASFWLAQGAGYFADEGYDVELVVPSAPAQTATFFEERKADVAVLPPPVYAGLVARRVPVVLVANLLANDPIDLVVRRSVLEARGLRADMPLRERLAGLRGVKLGIAPHPPSRLRALYTSVGLDADVDVEMVILHGKEQNAAFHDGSVDALYAHTPYLERAIVHDDAVMLVDQNRGEVPVLAGRQIHALAVHRSLLELRAGLATALVRAIARAEELVHRAPAEAAAVFARMFPARDRRELETIVRLYEPAIPKTPAVSAAQIPNAVTLFPAGQDKPDLSGIDLTKHVAPELYAPPKPPVSEAKLALLFVLVAALTATAGITIVRRRETRV